MARRVKWRLVGTGWDNKEYPLRFGENSVGRGDTNDIIILGLAVSRRHCVINIGDAEITIKDLGSGNGTFVDKCKLIPEQPTVLYNNTKIGFGWTDLMDIKENDGYVFKLVGDYGTPENEEEPISHETAKQQSSHNSSPHICKKTYSTNVIHLLTNSNVKTEDVQTEEKPIERKVILNSASLTCIDLLSDSDEENTSTNINNDENIKTIDHSNLDALSIKQEYIVDNPADVRTDEESIIWKAVKRKLTHNSAPSTSTKNNNTDVIDLSDFEEEENLLKNINKNKTDENIKIIDHSNNPPDAFSIKHEYVVDDLKDSDVNSADVRTKKERIISKPVKRKKSVNCAQSICTKDVIDLSDFVEEESLLKSINKSKTDKNIKIIDHCNNPPDAFSIKHEYVVDDVDDLKDSDVNSADVRTKKERIISKPVKRKKSVNCAHPICTKDVIDLSDFVDEENLLKNINKNKTDKNIKIIDHSNNPPDAFSINQEHVVDDLKDSDVNSADVTTKEEPIISKAVKRKKSVSCAQPICTKDVIDLSDFVEEENLLKNINKNKTDKNIKIIDHSNNPPDAFSINQEHVVDDLNDSDVNSADVRTKEEPIISKAVKRKKSVSCAQPICTKDVIDLSDFVEEENLLKNINKNKTDKNIKIIDHSNNPPDAFSIKQEYVVDDLKDSDVNSADVRTKEEPIISKAVRRKKSVSCAQPICTKDVIDLSDFVDEENLLKNINKNKTDENIKMIDHSNLDALSIKQDFIDVKTEEESIICKAVKRKLTQTCTKIIHLSDSDEEENALKRFKNVESMDHFDNDPLDAFSIKQEYFAADDDPVQVDSDSDSENEMWFKRLSQNSPGKALVQRSPLQEVEVSSTNTIPEELENDDSYFTEDIIVLPSFPIIESEGVNINKMIETKNSIPERTRLNNIYEKERRRLSMEKRTMVIDHMTMTKPNVRISSPKKSKPKRSRSKKAAKHEVDHISKSHKKEIYNERRQKLRELAEKNIVHNRELEERDVNSELRQKVAAKVTVRNRGAFLTEVQLPKPGNNKKKTTSPSTTSPKSIHLPTNRLERKENSSSSKHIHIDRIPSSETVETITMKDVTRETTSSEITREITPPADRSPLSPNITFAYQPKVNKKRVAFSSDLVKVRVFQIEQHNNMIKSVKALKSALIDVRHKAIISISQTYLKQILRWSPKWLVEQQRSTHPPPILTDKPKHILDTFMNYSQYAKVFSDLLLLEIWKCFTEANLRSVNKTDTWFEMKLISDPGVPLPDRCFDFIHLSVEGTIAQDDIKMVPRASDVMIVILGPQNQRFCYVQNVKIHPIRGMKKCVKFILNLHTLSTTMTTLKRDEILQGRILTSIKNEMNLFEAINYLPMTPLCEAIVSPKAELYQPINNEHVWRNAHKLKFNADLNPSQLNAVNDSVSIALGNKPAIRLIQGPPGTGKSRVICSIVMTYFYNESMNFIPGRKKILICATSNAAVDELVIRLHNIRESIEKDQRFRLVRVGRLEAMHPKARPFSSEDLAMMNIHKRAASHLDSNEREHFMSRINMWKICLNGTKDDIRRTYCIGRIKEIEDKIKEVEEPTMGKEKYSIRKNRLFAAECNIIEHAHIIVTTLSSAGSEKMKGLKGRVALCIVDEAAQSIEPETLIPLTLDINHIVLVGDQEQMPGYICSEDAKKYGLSESMFSRLVSLAGVRKELKAVTLLDVQYRMHPSISEYPNIAFYNGLIKNSPNTSYVLKGVPPYTMVAIRNHGKEALDNINIAEAWAVARLAIAANEITTIANMSIAIITPYKDQKRLLIKILSKMDKEIEVDTVDSFQGQERDVILVSLGRSSGVGFLAETGRINVMLTRAKKSLIICLNPSALASSPQWRTLIDDARRRGVYKSLPDNLCRPGAAGDHNILRYLTT